MQQVFAASATSSLEASQLHQHKTGPASCVPVGSVHDGFGGSDRKATSSPMLSLPGVTVAASTVWEILKDAGVDPSPDRAATSWAAFLRGQAEAILACDFLEAVTLSGQRQYVLAVIEHATRRIRILGATTYPTASWVAQAARNLVMDLEDAGGSIRYLIRDRDGRFCAAFDDVPTDAGVQAVLTVVRGSDAANKRAHGALGRYLLA